MRSRSLAALWSWRWLSKGFVAALAAFAVLSPASAAPPLAGAEGRVPARSTAGLSLTGDPLAPGYELTPSVLDFGDVLYDDTLERTFCIVNNGSVKIEILKPFSIVPAPGTVVNEFTYVRIRRPATCGGTSTQDRALPETLEPGELLEVTMRADPANRVGTMQAALTVTSNLGANPTRTLILRANSITGAFTVTPSSLLDFGNVDVQGPHVSQTITITNTSGGTLYLTSFARSDDPNFDFDFEIMLPGNTTLQPDGSVSIPVTYKPSIAAPPDSERLVRLNYLIGGIVNGPVWGTITIRGRGIDRKLSVEPPPMFPDTFRNPGALAPVRAVTVRNLGEATLKVSAVTISDAAWQVVDATPVDIAKGASHDFLVRFAPTAVGSTQAELVIMNDDNDRPMASVALVGTGINRNVQFGPEGAQEINLGYTGVGVPITTDDALVVTSKDPENTFQIRAIEFDQASQFQIKGLAPGLELPPMAERAFGVTFTAQKVGTFSVKARLYLDTDPEAQQEVTLTGNAVFVDAHGGGGCAASGARGPAGSALLVLAALLGLRRSGPKLRRQRRQ
ncbi:MAG TPA: choice-of-anchor D domain-containing protein [Kofleriaceae bacterium]|nr:choice-of-anchor D domain-containing protein [Kofleriaceae bacterium]